MTKRNNGPACGPALAIAAGVVAGTVALTGIPRTSAHAGDPYRQLARFGAVLALVQQKYVDRPDEAKLIQAALGAMAGSLDPHSGYIDGKQERALQPIIHGEFGNVGFTLVEHDRIPTVGRVADGTSAEKAGIVSGDRIEAIDGDAPIHTVEQAIVKLRGAPNTPVQIRIRRGDSVEAFKIIRDRVESTSVEFHIDGGDVGYVRIRQFVDSTAGELRAAMTRLAAEAPPSTFKGYVLDLRNNPGGFVNQAIETVNAFVESGTILSTRGRAAGADRTFVALPGEDLSKGRPMVVLINGGSASAAEIVAGSLQDLKRATLIGTRTFGKGSMQSTTRFGEGALHFTTALYFTPSGRSIQARGVDPDIEVAERLPVEGDNAPTGEASLEGHLRNPNGERQGSSSYVPADPGKDLQLAAAIAFLHQRSDRQGLGRPTQKFDRASEFAFHRSEP